MNLTLDRGALTTAISWAARALPRRPVIPVLAGVRLRARDGTLSVSACDYESSVDADVPANTAEPGEVLVSGRLLSDITGHLPAATVTLRTDGPRLRLTCGSVRFMLQTMPLQDHPALPAFPAPSLTVHAVELASAIDQVGVASGSDAAIPALTCVHLRLEARGPDRADLVLAATDRYRLACRILECTPRGEVPAVSGLVPAAYLAQTIRNLPDAPVCLGMGSGLLGLRAAGVQSTARLHQDSDFPAYDRLWPGVFTAEVTAEVAPLAEAVQRVAIAAERDTPIRLQVAGDTVHLTAETGDEAHAKETASLVAHVGDDLSIAYNPQFLLDGLTAADAKQVRIRFTTPTKPAVIFPADDDQRRPRYRHLLMPIHPSQ